MKFLLATSAIIAFVAAATFEDIKIALMSACVVLIPTVGLLLKAAIEAQTARLISARRGQPPAIGDPPGAAGEVE